MSLSRSHNRSTHPSHTPAHARRPADMPKKKVRINRYGTCGACKAVMAGLHEACFSPPASGAPTASTRAACTCRHGPRRGPCSSRGRPIACCCSVRGRKMPMPMAVPAAPGGSRKGSDKRMFVGRAQLLRLFKNLSTAARSAAEAVSRARWEGVVSHSFPHRWSSGKKCAIGSRPSPIRWARASRELPPPSPVLEGQSDPTRQGGFGLGKARVSDHPSPCMPPGPRPTRRRHPDPH